ncbi:MAG TPA: hypothetical protein DCQ32_11085 [Cyanobacteria bacterium UBA8156]|jgi:hypothetical protein|nr:hypothetical protein [Cyanobacteria bacterium UBA8156]
MLENRISASLTPEDQQAVMAAIATLREKLPFLTDISPEERRSLPKMGDKSRAFVQKAMEIAQQNEGILPRAFDLEEMRKDVQLAADLYPILLAIAQLHELVDDTYLVVGSEAYAGALLVYNAAKMNNVGGLDDTLDELGKRFARKARGKQV